MYIVTSKPIRRSLKVGLVHIADSSLLLTPVNSGASINSAVRPCRKRYFGTGLACHWSHCLYPRAKRYILGEKKRNPRAAFRPRSSWFAGEMTLDNAALLVDKETSMSSHKHNLINILQCCRACRQIAPAASVAPLRRSLKD